MIIPVNFFKGKMQEKNTPFCSAIIYIFKELGYHKMNEQELDKLMISLKVKKDKQKSTNCNDKERYSMYDFLVSIKSRTI